MTGTKTNERPGTRASVKFVRSSAYKAREILNLIRDKSYAEASEILAFSERGISQDIARLKIKASIFVVRMLIGPAMVLHFFRNDNTNICYNITSN